MQNTQSPNTNPALSRLHKLRWAVDMLDKAIRENDGPNVTPTVTAITDNLFNLTVATADIVRGVRSE